MNPQAPWRLSPGKGVGPDWLDHVPPEKELFSVTGGFVSASAPDLVGDFGLANGEVWSKQVGPFFLHVNGGADPEALWREGLTFELNLVGRVNPHFGRSIEARVRRLARVPLQAQRLSWRRSAPRPRPGGWARASLAWRPQQGQVWVQ